MHYQFCIDLRHKGEISPHWIVNGLRKVNLSDQVKVWLILSESQLALIYF